MFGIKKLDLDSLTGYKLMQDGYIMVTKPSGYPHPGRKVMHHRLVMEKEIGRLLTKKEVVHHRDENKENNLLENLELFASSQEHLNRRHGAIKYPRLYEKAWLKTEYGRKKRSVTDIAAELGCDHTLVLYALKKIDVERRRYTMTAAALEARKKGARAKKPRKHLYDDCDAVWIKKEYTKERRSFRHIAEELGWHKNKVKRYLEELGVPLRGHKEAARLFLAKRKK